MTVWWQKRQLELLVVVLAGATAYWHEQWFAAPFVSHGNYWWAIVERPYRPWFAGPAFSMHAAALLIAAMNRVSLGAGSS